MNYEFPQYVKSDFAGYEVFADLYHKTGSISFDEIILDFKWATWFEANLTAVLGAILDRAVSQSNNVKIDNLPEKIETVLERNHFLSHFGGRKIRDFYGTTIKYKKFKTTEEKFFKVYLDMELLSKEAMPEMSALLRKKMNESIFEIFNNAVLHGNCQHIFSCGQYYPDSKRLDFTIVDFGRSVKANVNEYLRKNLSGEDSLNWAVERGNTTRTGTIPGGLGFSLIREFIKKNSGKIQIVSADGYWEQDGSSMNSKTFSRQIPGTVVNLRFNVADKEYYYLASEVDERDIF